jgi:hypothetical protein
MSQPSDKPLFDVPRVSPRWFAGIVGGILLLIGIIMLATPVTAERGSDSARCGTGFQGASPDAGYKDAGISIADAMYGDFTEPETTFEELCNDAIGTRRAWGWPVGGLGAIVVLGAALVRAPARDE